MIIAALRDYDMRESLRTALLWYGLALLCYLVGIALFLVGGVGPFLAPPAYSLSNLTTVHIALVGASALLFGLGGTLNRKAGPQQRMPGGTTQPIGTDRSTLADLGYRVPPEDEHESTTVYEDGELYVRCPECGAKNETRYTYCGGCSAELPEP